MYFDKEKYDKDHPELVVQDEKMNNDFEYFIHDIKCGNPISNDEIIKFIRTKSFNKLNFDCSIFKIEKSLKDSSRALSEYNISNENSFINKINRDNERISFIVNYSDRGNKLSRKELLELFD